MIVKNVRRRHDSMDDRIDLLLLQSTSVYDAVQIDLLFQWHVYDSLSKFRDFMYFYSLYIAIKSWTLSPIY